MTRPRCRESADRVSGTCEALSTSCIPFGSAGTIGMYLRSEDTFIREWILPLVRKYTLGTRRQKPESLCSLCRLVYLAACAFVMHSFRVTQFTAFRTLRDGPSFLLDFEDGAIGVIAGRRPMAFDAGFTALGEPCVCRSKRQVHTRRTFCRLYTPREVDVSHILHVQL